MYLFFCITLGVEYAFNMYHNVKLELSSKDCLSLYERITGEPQKITYRDISRTGIDLIREDYLKAATVDDIVDELFDYDQFKMEHPDLVDYLTEEMEERADFLVIHQFGFNLDREPIQTSKTLVAEYLPERCKAWWRDNVFGPALFSNWHYGG